MIYKKRFASDKIGQILEAEKFGTWWDWVGHEYMTGIWHRQIIVLLRSVLSHRLPIFSIPSRHFLPLGIPMNTSGVHPQEGRLAKRVVNTPVANVFNISCICSSWRRGTSIIFLWSWFLCDLDFLGCIGYLHSAEHVWYQIIQFRWKPKPSINLCANFLRFLVQHVPWNPVIWGF